MPPLEVQGDAALARMNAEELFANGASAYGSGDWARAAACFERLVLAYPDSPHLRLAQYNAGLARERMGDWEEARGHFAAISNPAANITNTAMKNRRSTVKLIIRNANDARDAIAGKNSNITWPRSVFIEPRLNASRK